MSTVTEIEAAIEQLPVEQVREVAAWLEEYQAALRTSTKGAPERRDFRSAIGSYHRDYPDEAIRDSNAWLKEIREGDVY